MRQFQTADLESFVLKDFFDRNIVITRVGADQSCLEDDAKGPVSNDFTVGVRDLFLLPSSVACNDLGDLCWVIDRCITDTA